tara:strand:- start:4601 stop:5239 length:639 start_codon:yes stop_codon:yes gene_type:complete
MNYTTLSLTIQQYVENTESSFVANIPTFVQLAEERIYNSVQLPAIRRNVTGNLTTGVKYLQLPTDWLATFSLAVIDPVTDAQEFLLNKDVNYIRQAYPDPNDEGSPQHYAQFDANTLLLGPTPDENYAMELHYYYYPESIVTAGTSWLGDNFETVLLYGALREAYIYMKGETDMLANYEAKYQESLMLLKILGDGKDRRDAYRSGQVRVPVS